MITLVIKLGYYTVSQGALSWVGQTYLIHGIWCSILLLRFNHSLKIILGCTSLENILLHMGCLASFMEIFYRVDFFYILSHLSYLDISSAIVIIWNSLESSITYLTWNIYYFIGYGDGGVLWRGMWNTWKETCVDFACIYIVSLQYFQHIPGG